MIAVELELALEFKSEFELAFELDGALLLVPSLLRSRSPPAMPPIAAVARMCTERTVPHESPPPPWAATTMHPLSARRANALASSAPTIVEPTTTAAAAAAAAATAAAPLADDNDDDNAGDGMATISRRARAGVELWMERFMAVALASPQRPSAHAPPELALPPLLEPPPPPPLPAPPVTVSTGMSPNHTAGGRGPAPDAVGDNATRQRHTVSLAGRSPVPVPVLLPSDPDPDWCPRSSSLSLVFSVAPPPPPRVRSIWPSLMWTLAGCPAPEEAARRCGVAFLRGIAAVGCHVPMLAARDALEKPIRIFFVFYFDRRTGIFDRHGAA